MLQGRITPTKIVLPYANTISINYISFSLPYTALILLLFAFIYFIFCLPLVFIYIKYI